MTENTINTLEKLEVSARLDDVTEPPPMPEEPADLDKDQREAIAQMVRQAKDAGIALTGPDGLLKALTAQIVEPPPQPMPSGRSRRSPRSGAGPTRP